MGRPKKKINKWDKLGITKELYESIYSDIKKDQESEIKEKITSDVKNEILNDFEDKVTNDQLNKIKTPRADKLINKLKQFKIKLSDDKAMWSTPDNKIQLSVFDKTKTLSKLIKEDDSNIEMIKKAYEIGYIDIVSEKTSAPVYETKHFSNNMEIKNQRKIKMSEDVRNTLNHPEAKAIELINRIDNIDHLITLGDLERRSKNLVKRTRQNVISSINHKVRVLQSKENAIEVTSDEETSNVEYKNTTNKK